MAENKKYDMGQIAILLNVSYNTINNWFNSLLELGYVYPEQKHARKIELEEFDLKAVQRLQFLMTHEKYDKKRAAKIVVKEFSNRKESNPAPAILEQPNMDNDKDKEIEKAFQEMAEVLKADRVDPVNQRDYIEYTFGQVVDLLEIGQRAYAVDDYAKNRPYIRRAEGIMFVDRDGIERRASLLNNIISKKYTIQPLSMLVTYQEARKAADEGKMIKPVGMMTYLDLAQLRKIRFTIDEIEGQWEVLNE